MYKDRSALIGGGMMIHGELKNIKKSVILAIVMLLTATPLMSVASESEYVYMSVSYDDKYINEKGEVKPNPALSMQMKKLISIRSFGSWLAQHPHKVRVNLLGEISKV